LQSSALVAFLFPPGLLNSLLPPFLLLLPHPSAWARFRTLCVASSGRGGSKSGTKQKFPYSRLSRRSGKKKHEEATEKKKKKKKKKEKGNRGRSLSQ
jgi:hypothetical protein